MSGEALAITALVILAALLLAYLLVQLDNRRPALARRLTRLLVLVQVVLTLVKCGVECG